MTRLFSIVICFILFTAFSACKKQNCEIVESIKVSLKSTDTYQYNLGQQCIECGVSISRQAQHYQISEVVYPYTPNTPQGFNTVYNYKPALNYIGKDEVEIKLTNFSEPNNPGKRIIITFTITN